MSHLRSIVYVSTGVGHWSPDMLETLLIQARALNAQTDVTGALLFGRGNFMQCIEGTAQEVDRTYARILASRRHTNIIELIDERIEARSFPDWQMGFRETSGSALLGVSSAKWSSAAEAGKTANEGPGPALLRAFWSNLR